MDGWMNKFMRECMNTLYRVSGLVLGMGGTLRENWLPFFGIWGCGLFRLCMLMFRGGSK